jgi:membrane protein DedA with SNARE-associated domain
MLLLIDALAIESWLQAGGYIALFAVLCACGMGLPLPEDIPLIVAGALTATGHLQLLPTALVAWAGILVGDLFLYFLGRRFGPGVSKLPLIGRHVTPARLKRVEEMFAKYGIWVIGIGRLLAGIRAAVIVSAGAVKYPLGRLMLVDAIAAAVSGGFFLMLGHYLGHNLPGLLARVEHVKGTVLLVAILLGVLAVAAFVLRRNRARPAVD